MKAIKYLIISAIVALAVACKPAEGTKKVPNNAIWLWGKHMKEAPLKEYAEKGYGHILLNEAAFNTWGEAEVYAFVEECKSLGIVPHVWFQCFYKDGGWAYPLDDEKKVLKQEFYDDIVARASKYIKGGFDGIHLDYIRFGGTAHKHDYPEAGLRANDVVTECCRQLNVALKAINPKVILSAALMPEIDSEHFYGQDPAAMGQYLDILMPMVYRYNYAGEDKSLEWVYEVSNWFVEKGAPAEVWVGIQTYTSDVKDDSITPMDAERMYKDCIDVTNTKATGLVLFRHGIGEFPDVNDLWK